MKDIQKLIGKNIPVVKDHPYASEVPIPAEEKAKEPAVHTPEKKKANHPNRPGKNYRKEKSRFVPKTVRKQLN